MAGASLAAPAAADTKQELESAKEQLAAAQSSLDAATATWQAAEQRVFDLQARVAQTVQAISRLERELEVARARLAARARAAFMFGADGGTLSALLNSTTFADFADGVQFAASLAQEDEDLAVEVQAKAEQLKRLTGQLQQDLGEQQAATQRFAERQADVRARVEDLAATVDELQRKLNQEQRAEVGLPGGGFPAGGSGAIQICPVQGPVSFVDSFGWPRPGGRIHEGIDMISPEGTPVVAVHAGVATRNPNTLGGNAVVLYHAGSSDWTYYAHLSAYGAEGNVSAGTVIGYVGHTGDTSTNHLHFEYHPGGGAAVDPYQALLAVC
ncbi:MAG TPA: peptidoglycan DD-metalloendopeptidase family protein [Actinomycetota bacterium]